MNEMNFNKEITRTIEFAKEAHGDQKRKYTGEPYYWHPGDVSIIMMANAEYFTLEMAQAAILHDTLEDTLATFDDIVVRFGLEVATLVHWCSDPSIGCKGNRAKRKEMDRKFYSTAPANAQTIKLADLIHNTASIVEHDENFAKVYMREKLALLEVLTKGDKKLFRMATDQVFEYYLKKLDNKK